MPLFRPFLRATNVPFLCQGCASKAPRRPRWTNFATKAGNASQQSRRRSTRNIAAAGVAAGTGTSILLFGDDLRHYYQAVERSSRVVSTLYLNISDYRKALKPQSEDEAEQASILKACHKRCAERTLRVLEKNGSIFIKLGQHLSSMGYLLPLEWTETFIPLQDKCPVSPYESIEKMFEKDTGHPISELFDSFDSTPIGSASLAQVHRATLKGTGRSVAVKVQHPSLEEWVPLDMALTRFTFATLKRWFPEYDLEWLSNEMDSSLPQELDFALEGQHAMRTREYFKKIPSLPLIVPEVEFGLKRILVMEYISGHRPDDLKYIDDNGIDRDEVAAALARIFNEMIFGKGAPLHCDPHGGNIAVRKNNTRMYPNFDIILYDHGLYRDIPLQLKRDYAKLWLAVIDTDLVNMRKYAAKVAGITDAQFPLFASAITGRDYQVIQKSVVSARTLEEKDEISGALSDGLLPQLVQMLGQVPRIMLLILKTNDLTRSLDENLHTRQGPVRTFLILARYCSRTIYEEQVEIAGENGSLLRPRNALRLLSAWTMYVQTEFKLSLYEYYLALRQVLGFSPVEI